MGILKKIFGTKNERYLKKLKPIIQKINEIEPEIQKLSDDELRAQTGKFKEKLKRGATLDDILVEAFATVREAARRTLGMRHFDVQLIGGIVLHQGKIAEMKTGEGKTLVATLPAYLNALEGKGVHIVTVNDYLAQRDAEWMGKVYRFLGLTVGVIIQDLSDEERKKAYNCDITYGTNNEFGFDYLRDNMKYNINDYVHRYYPEKVKDKHGKIEEKLFNYAIVDEVDSVLIDEARTPLIISGHAEESSEIYYRVNSIIPFLKKDQDYLVDEKNQTVSLIESGIDKVEKRLGLKNLYDPENVEIIHIVNQALRAHNLFKRDVHYLVEDGKVVIVDEFTGRKMPGRRWSDGLHQAIEAKEGLKIQAENQTLATVTFQNYFKMYKKLAGMTGTADTEAEEFEKIYNLEVVVIPTNKPMIRKDYNDVIYKTERGKFKAIVDEIEDCYRRGQPVLVGTISVDVSERISKMLKKRGIPHNVLNAKHHAREAEIVAQAGRYKAVTIATNMAGRGTDIVLGGNPEFLAKQKAPEGTEEYKKWYEFFKKQCDEERKKVIAAGGLHIIGTERHESRRIDNQLRGRAGRQGDPGSSRFFLSLEDNLLRIFGGDRLKELMTRFNIPDDQPIEHRWITKQIENAQKKVESQNFEIRKNLLEYDDVMNEQRRTIYGLRRKVLEGKETHDLILKAIEEVVYATVDTFCPEDQSPDEWDIKGLENRIYQIFLKQVDLSNIERDFDAIAEYLSSELKKYYEEREKTIVENLAYLDDEEEDEEKRKEKALKVWREYEIDRFLRAIDSLWMEHLKAMDHLKETVQLHAYAQKDPKNIYKKEAFEYFTEMLSNIYKNVVEPLFRVEIRDKTKVERRKRAMSSVHYGRGQTPGSKVKKVTTYRRKKPKIGRNDPCPCGSGKKYKHCCMKKDMAAHN